MTGRRFKTARDLAETVFAVSDQTILRTARKHGIGKKMGRTRASATERQTASTVRAAAFSEKVFELGKDLFDRVQVGRIMGRAWLPIKANFIPL